MLGAVGIDRPSHHGIQRYRLLNHPIPKEGPHKASLRPIWTSFWDGGGIEGGILEAHHLKRNDIGDVAGMSGLKAFRIIRITRVVKAGSLGRFEAYPEAPNGPK